MYFTDVKPLHRLLPAFLFLTAPFLPDVQGSSMPLDFLWTPTAVNGSNVTEFTCQCFSYMDATTGRCVASTITNREEAMKKEIDNTPLLKMCAYKRVILGLRVVIQCPYQRNESYWSSLGRWTNSSDICVENDSGGIWNSCGRSARLVLTLKNQIIIDPIMSTDPGLYECVKINQSTNRDEEVFRLGIVIDYDTGLYGQLVYSSIVGAAAATAFLAIALSAHFLRVLIEYCRQQEMNKHVQWVIEFVSRQHLPANGMHTPYHYPSNGANIPGTISEEVHNGIEVIEVDESASTAAGKPPTDTRLAVRNWGNMPVRMEQLSAIRERASQQMDRVRARYYERAQRVRTQCGSQMDQLHQRYHDKLSKMKDYSSNRYYNLRVRYYKKRQDLHNYANMKMTLIRDNYQMQRQYLSKVMDSLAIDSCRSYAPSFIGAGSEDYQASLGCADSFAAGLDLDLGDDGTISMASSKRLPPPVEEEDDSVNIDLEWECLTPPEPPPPKEGGSKKSKNTEDHKDTIEEVPASVPDSPVAIKSNKLAACLLPCHAASFSQQHSHQIPPALLRCSAFHSGVCSDGRHNHVHGPKQLSNGPLADKKSQNDTRAKSAVIPDSNGTAVTDAVLTSDGKSSSEPVLNESLRAVEASLPFADD